MTDLPWQDEIERRKIQDYVMPVTALFPCDVGIVFGTRHGVDEFVASMASLLERNLVKHLLITGGPTSDQPTPEADILFDKLSKALPDLDRTKILLERVATNTGENVQLSQTMLKQEGLFQDIRSVLAVGKISSMRRYMMTIKRWWPEVETCCMGVNYFGVEREAWHTNDEFRKRVLGEYEKIPRYVRDGFLTEIDI
ncbi:MAG: YdcF family protein [Pseudomonadaceae bacterium]|nr:YdcF family protein [Pseudomonadaceae bacterium]